jgi:hypothetical protein
MPHVTRYCFPPTITVDRLDPGQDTLLAAGGAAEVTVLKVGVVRTVLMVDGAGGKTGGESVDGNGTVASLAAQTAALE